MKADEIVAKLLQLHGLLEELLPAARALQDEERGPARLERALSAVRKYNAADKARWVTLAACPDFYLHSKRSTAILIARREGLPVAAAETIRRAI